MTQIIVAITGWMVVGICVAWVLGGVTHARTAGLTRMPADWRPPEARAAVGPALTAGARNLDRGGSALQRHVAGAREAGCHEFYDEAWYRAKSRDFATQRNGRRAASTATALNRAL